MRRSFIKYKVFFHVFWVSCWNIRFGAIFNFRWTFSVSSRENLRNRAHLFRHLWIFETILCFNLGRFRRFRKRRPSIPVIAIFTVYKHSFCYSNVPTMKTKELVVSTANRPLVGTLISKGDVTRNTAISSISLCSATKLIKYSKPNAVRVRRNAFMRDFPYFVEIYRVPAFSTPTHLIHFNIYRIIFGVGYFFERIFVWSERKCYIFVDVFMVLFKSVAIN